MKEHADGSIAPPVVWGHPKHGGNATTVQSALEDGNITDIFSNQHAFVVVKRVMEAS